MKRLRFHYESPTCALDLWAEASALGAWSEVAAVHPLRFKLRLYAAISGRSSQIIRGNAQQFMSLVAALGTTQQQWLGRDDLNLLNADFRYSLPAQSGLPPLNLSLLQWCDLNDHFDTLNTNVMLLPEFEVRLARWHWSWLTILATALTLAGITWATIRVLMPSPQTSPQFSVASKVDDTEDLTTKKAPLPQDRPSGAAVDKAAIDRADNKSDAAPSPQNSRPQQSEPLEPANSSAKDRKSDAITEPVPPRPLASKLPAAVPPVALNEPNASDSKIAAENTPAVSPAAPVSPVQKPNSPRFSAPAAQPERSSSGGMAAPSATGRTTRNRAANQDQINSGTTTTALPDGTLPNHINARLIVREFGGNPKLAASLEQYLRKNSGLALPSNTQGQITLQITLRHDAGKTTVMAVTVVSNNLAPAPLVPEISRQFVNMVRRWQPNFNGAATLPPQVTVEITIERQNN